MSDGILFSITCESCAARLKVRNPALIGQRLACPRCREMLQVVAPPGFVPPPKPRPPDQSATDASASGMSAAEGPVEVSDFEDIQAAIDRALARQQPPTADSGQTGLPVPTAPDPGNRQVSPDPASSPLAMPPNRAAANNAFVAAEADRRRRSADADADRFSKEPPASGPAADWTHARIRTRRRILLGTIGGSLALVLMAVLLVATGIFGGPENNDAGHVAQNPPGNPAETPETTPSADPAESGRDPEPVPAAGGQPPPEANPGETDPGPLDHAAVAGEADQQGGGTPAAMPPAGSAPPAIPGLDPEPAAVPGVGPAKADIAEPQELGQPRAGIVERPLTSQRPGEGAQVGQLPAENIPNPNPFGDLGALMQAQGMSLSSIEQAAASVLPQVEIGIPEFVIERSEPKPVPDRDGTLALPVGKIAFMDVPLSIALRELSQLSALPVAWDIRAVLDAGLDPNQKISIDVRDATLGDAFHAAADAAGLEITPQDWGLGVFPKGDLAVVTRRFRISAGDLPGTGRLDLLAVQIPLLVAPGTWSDASAGYQCFPENGELVVTHTQRTVRAVGNLLLDLEKLAADPAAEVAPPRWIQAGAVLDREIALPPVFDAPIEDYLARLERELGMTVLIDWSTVTPATGWSLQTVVPGNLTAKTGRGLLDGLSRALGLSWQAIGPGVFLMTTPAASAATHDFHVFPVAAILKGGLSAENLEDLLARATAGKIPGGAWTHVFFDPAAEAMVVSAPPIALRQVAAVLSSLAAPPKTASSR